MKRKQQRELEGLLRQEGIDVLAFERVGKHYKLHIQKGGVKCFSTVGGTISDWRAIMNIVMYAKRNIEAAKKGYR